jgi:hypothetical protein
MNVSAKNLISTTNVYLGEKGVNESGKRVRSRSLRTPNRSRTEFIDDKPPLSKKIVTKHETVISNGTAVDLFYPVEPKHNPNESTIQEDLTSFLKNDIGILKNDVMAIEKFEAIKIDLLASTTFPYLSETSDLLTTAKWLTFLFYHDDFFEKESLNIYIVKSLHKNIMSHLKTGDSKSFKISNENKLLLLNSSNGQTAMRRINHIEKFVGILSSVVNEGLKDVSESGRWGFLSEVNNYFCGTENEIQIKAKINFTDNKDTLKALYREYDEIRIDSGSVNSLFVLGDILKYKDVDIFTYFNTHVKSLSNLANYAVCFSNDIYSEPKERIKNKENKIVAMNKVFILEKMGLTRSAAIDKVAKEHNHCTQKFVDIISDLNIKDKKLLDQINIIKCWFYSNREWSEKSGRYSNIVFCNV